MNQKCSCRWKNCKRHGNCDECRAYHRTHEKYPLPFCEKKKSIGSEAAKKKK